MKYQQIEILKKKLKTYLKNKLIIDIFFIGSFIKDKFEINDLDIIVLFREKNYKEIEKIIYEIKISLNIEGLHIEPLIVDNMFSEKIFSSLLHEGISIKYNENISKVIGYNPSLLFTFSLGNLNNLEKVRFAQTIYGREGKGLLNEEGGKMIGKGAFLVPIEKEHLFRDVMVRFAVKYEVKRIMIKY